VTPNSDKLPQAMTPNSRFPSLIMAARSLNLSSLPIRRLEDQRSSTHCQLCGCALAPGQYRCVCGVVNFAACKSTAQAEAEIQELLKSIETWAKVEEETPKIRDVRDLPMRSIWESQEKSECLGCGQTLGERKYRCACGLVNFLAFPKDSQSFEQVRDAIAPVAEPVPTSLPPKEPARSSLSYITAAVAVALLITFVIIRRLR